MAEPTEGNGTDPRSGAKGENEVRGREPRRDRFCPLVDALELEAIAKSFSASGTTPDHP